MKTLKLTLTIFFVFSTLLFSCEEEFECDPYFPYFKIEGLESVNLEFTDTGSNPWVRAGETKPVHWEDYFIRNHFETTYHASKPERRSGGANVYALSCMPSGDAGSQTGIDTLFVVTVHDYNNNYKANDTINSAILLNDWTYHVKDFNEFKPLAQYVVENKEGVAAETFEIKFTEAPQAALSEQRFKIIYHLTNGDVFETTTSTINLTR